MSGKLRAPLSAILLAAVAFAIGLSASPQLHARLHKSDVPNHECAATLFASGSVEFSAAVPVFSAPQPVPVPGTVRLPLVRRVQACLEFSRLEHAPPALS